jgi:hypothetical protein
MIKARELKVGAIYLGNLSKTLLCLLSHTHRNDYDCEQTWLKLDKDPQVFKTDYESHRELEVTLIVEL